MGYEMKLFTKAKEKKEEKEPQFYLSSTNIQTRNYKVYYMNMREKVLCFLLAFIVGAAVGYLFYGGIGKDEFGNPTQVTRILNFAISVLTGSIAGIMFLLVRVQQKIKKYKNELRQQFRDMLEISEDIETIITSNKTEQNVMMCMPILLIGMIKMMSPDFASNFVSVTGIISTTIAIILFVAAYYVGRAVLDIKL